MAYVQCTDTPFVQSGTKIYRITDDTAGGTVVTLKWNTSSLPYGLCDVVRHTAVCYRQTVSRYL